MSFGSLTSRSSCALVVVLVSAATKQGGFGGIFGDVRRRHDRTRYDSAIFLLRTFVVVFSASGIFLALLTTHRQCRVYGLAANVYGKLSRTGEWRYRFLLFPSVSLSTPFDETKTGRGADYRSRFGNVCCAILVTSTRRPRLGVSLFPTSGFVLCSNVGNVDKMFADTDAVYILSYRFDVLIFLTLTWRFSRTRRGVFA